MIEVTRLTKVYRRRVTAAHGWARARSWVSPSYVEHKAVDDITFRIGQGEMVGYIGANGAGKSTTIKCLAGILVPTAGEVRVAGRIPWRERRTHVRHIGVVFGQRSQLQWDLPLRESLLYMRYVYGLPKTAHDEEMARQIRTLGLDEFLDTPVRQLSLGQRMRGELAAALLHRPSVLFLDEPTIGLDVVAKAELRGMLKTLNVQEGVTVLMTTHDLADIEALCQRVVVIDRGQLLYDGQVTAFNRLYGGPRTLSVTLKDDAPLPPLSWPVKQTGRDVEIVLKDEEVVPSLLARLLSTHRLSNVSFREPTLEDSVRRLYESPGTQL